MSSVLILQVSVAIDNHQTFSANLQNQGKILFVRPLKYYYIYIYNLHKFLILHTAELGYNDIDFCDTPSIASDIL